MKKITLKITAFLLLTLFALQVQSQEIAPLDSDGYGFFNTTSPGTWKIKLRDQVDGETLFLTVNNNLKAVWTTELENNHPSQLWIYSEYTAGSSNFTIATAVPAIAGQVLKADVTSTGLEPDLIIGAPGVQDEMQMRKFSNIETGYASNNSLPGQNAILLASDKTGTAWATAPNNVRIGSTPVKNATIKLGQSQVALRFKFISAPLSNNKFDASSIFISNPVKNQLNIKGLTDNVNKVSIFSLLGQEVLSKKVDAQSSINIDVSTLSKGMYIVELSGDSGKFTKKIIKQ
ncbi:T9SS type A sorting domain-containing protein [Mariniflexile aquimaris]|uniref:T9SS type A sorting domain-containing protein n=1 Tax=Mariniflexile aquimaris TaxID=881009 RepID=A0ABW3BTF4_9FLAO